MEYILSLVMTAFIYLAHKSAQEIQGHSKFRFIDHFPMLLPNLTRFKSMLEPCLALSYARDVFYALVRFKANRFQLPSNQ